MAENALDRLIAELSAHPVNTNQFFLTFRQQRLNTYQLQAWLRQYHHFCKQFVKILEGLLYRTPVDEMEMRVELVKTLYSELGSGRSDEAHIRLLERFATAIGLSPTELSLTIPIPEVADYLSVLRQLFIEGDYLVALGAELAVEVTAASEFRYFYPALQAYNSFSTHDLVFFEMHLAAEDDHSTWLTAAVQKTAKSPGDFEQVTFGARTTADAWHQFWQGLHCHVFSAPAFMASA